MSDHLEWGTVKDGSNDAFLSCTPGQYDEAVKGLSGEKHHIIRIPRRSIEWLAISIMHSLSEEEFENVIVSLEEMATDQEEGADVG